MTLRSGALLLITIAMLASGCQSTPPALPAAPDVPDNAPTIALVLGGGGAKGLAHVGVIKALHEHNIAPAMIVGTSSGSLIGSLYASGMTTDKLEHLAITTPDRALMRIQMSNQGVIDASRLKDFVNQQVGNQPIEALPIRFAAIATEKHTQKKAVLRSGNTGLAVQASSSVPGLFIAPRIPEKVGKKYIDGGVVSLVPVDSARDLGADIVIAVDVTADQAPATLPNLADFRTLGSFWGLLEHSVMYFNQTNQASTGGNNHGERDRADVVIMPKTGAISTLDTRQRRALIDAGYAAATAHIDEIQQIITRKKSTMNTP